MVDQIYAALDLETTGLRAGFDEIMEVGIVRCTPDDVLERYNTLVRPLEMPPLRIQRLTGITPDDLAAAPTWDEVAERVNDLLDGATLLGHNIEFDAAFLREAGVKLNRQVDTLELSRIVDPLSPTHRLTDLCDRYGIEADEAHRALSDAEAARQVFLQQRERYTNLPLEARDELAEIVMGSSLFWSAGRVLRDWELSIPRSRRQGSPARRVVSQGGAPAHVDLPDGSLPQLTEQAFASIVDEGFERREEQLAMARDVANSVQNGGTQIVEAGTGTGKSLAYLVPAALWALKLGRTVVISTNTINLQQQLAGNDVEFARRLIKGVSPEAADALKATVVKGRGNYLCQERLDTEVGRATSWDDPALLARIATWRHLSRDGDRAELRLPPDQMKLWSRFTAEDTSCFSNPSCLYTNGARAGECFLLQVQRNAQRSHIVITNHALLLTSLISGSMLLPEAPVVIIDESHTLEDVATGVLSDEMTKEWLMEAVTELTEEFELLAEQGASQDLQKLAQQLSVAANQAELRLADAFDRIAEFVAQFRQERGDRDDRVTLTAGTRNSNEWSALEEHWERSISDVAQLTQDAQRVLLEEPLLRDPDAGPPEHALEGAQGKLLDLRERVVRMTDVVTKHSDATVAWVERDNQRSEKTGLYSSPISVAAALQPLWQKHAAILTGATLATSQADGEEFSYLRERLGIESPAEAQYDSPFDYKSHAKVFLPIEAPFGNDPEHDGFVAAAVKQLAVAAEGRTMVLFRSYRSMNYVAKQIGSELELAGLALLRQGRDGSPSRIVEALQSDPRSVAFGVAALWTGVDIPGQALSQLIVTKLPFDPPTDPVKKARAEQYDNAFREYALPNAVIQFRQGVGRLIRSRSDVGVIVVLDGRVLRRDYGGEFRRALPPAPIVESPLIEVAAAVKRFLPS